MQIPIRPLVLGLLLASSATAARAHPKAPAAAPPAAAPQSAPIDLALYPAATSPSIPIDPTLRPAAALQSTPTDFLLHPTATPQWPLIEPALHPAAATPPTLIDLTVHPAPALQSTSTDPALPVISPELQRVARWVTDSGDNVGLPYLLIDKVNARVFAYSPAGQLQGSAPALLGMARGDRLIAANDTKMAAMTPQVRITPAGRFVSRLAIDSHGKELLVLDYNASISLHAVVKGTPAERRAERLKSATSQDNRISFGCINVPAEFYTKIVSPGFTGTKGIVYVLPETGPASELFGFQPGGATVSGAQQGATAVSARPAQSIPAPDAR